LFFFCDLEPLRGFEALGINEAWSETFGSRHQIQIGF